LGKRIREAFVPSKKDNLFLSADYSQIELRVLAHLSKDKVLEKAFESNVDVHSYTASLVYDVALKDVTPKMRSVAKTVNFSVVYGVSAFGLSRDLHIDIKEAKEFIDNYFKRYPQVKNYIDKTIKNAEVNGYVKTLFDRRRYIPQLKSNNVQQVNFGKRIAINMPVQGTASDLIKIAMIAIYNRIINEKFSSKMILQIHDELIFDVKSSEIEKLKKVVKEEMENAVKLDVPIIVDIKMGKNWAEC
jgi:DNA polymerase-1